MKIYTKESLIESLKEIRARGWIPNARLGNDGGVGNTLEDLLGIEENNLPIPNAAEWELKCQRTNTSSLTTMLHTEPSPRALKFVPQVLLPNYGWKHKQAGKKYPTTEMSFRQTIHTQNRSDRGFKVEINKGEGKIEISFHADSVGEKHFEWKRGVAQKIGLEELSPQPYWGFDDLLHKIGNKLHNCFYVKADVKRENKKEFYYYRDILMLKKISLEGIIKAFEQGDLLIDFDARTGHNHGTKIRIRQNKFDLLYEEVIKI